MPTSAATPREDESPNVASTASPGPPPQSTMGMSTPLCQSLVPDNTFGEGPVAARTLCVARWFLFVLYFVLISVFGLYLTTFIMGRVEIIDHRMKYDKLEAPSIAVCPWNPGDTILQQTNASYTIYAVHISLKGATRLPNMPRRCQFDRTCECLDLQDVVLMDTEDAHHGPTGLESKEVQNFRESIEIRTTLMDSSSTQTLKFGLYDSMDHRPSWFYAPQWYMLIGQLRLDSWMVSEENAANLKAMFTGDMGALDRRHFYNFDFSSSVGEHNQRYTRIWYEFRTFFVMETISAQKAWSLFTVVALLILLIGLSNVLMIWELLFPVYSGGAVQRRQVSRPMRWLCRSFCCLDLRDGHEDRHWTKEKSGDADALKKETGQGGYGSTSSEQA